jgi:cystathionine beta-lyase/cystathionine gamma-synthase
MTNKVEVYIHQVIENMPIEWLNLTTHRLDIYEEKLAKTQFLDQLKSLFEKNISDKKSLTNLPTAYDYIRLGHPLSCILEWNIAKLNNLPSANVISFSSKTISLFSILRKNALESVNTQIIYTGEPPLPFDDRVLKEIYGYSFDLVKVEDTSAILPFDGSTVYISKQEDFSNFTLNENIDFSININTELGSILAVNGTRNEDYISEIQHVRRRETIAITPSNSLIALKQINNIPLTAEIILDTKADKDFVEQQIQSITKTSNPPLVGSSGLSIQYAIMMGLIDFAYEKHSGKDIKIIVPPNCYGGTNDQARRVANSITNVSVVDLPVDGDNDMVQSIDMVLKQIAEEDAVPFIIAEIPTNPRVEVPNLQELKAVLSQKRKTKTGKIAVDPVFILDQTFCPNVPFLEKNEILSTIRSISYASGSKFPSGGKCTAGYCAGNDLSIELMKKIGLHLSVCDNEATNLQYKLLADQLPSMLERIQTAYINTRDFVNFIHENLPEAKINFVSEELAEQGFTPSVFSLDLPTKGNNEEEKETYKRELNLTLINLMINEIPDESKYCVSYGQLKGCYWTIPATSTQGTTKEGDKDYIARVALSSEMNLDLHKKVFLEFVKNI